MAVVPELSELAHRVEEQLGRFGVAGRVQVDGENLVLIGHGPRVQTNVSSDVELFRGASETQRRPIVERVARELATRRRASMTSVAPGSRWLDWLRVLPGLAIIGGGLYGAWHWLGRPAQQAVAPLLPSSGSVLVQAATPDPAGGRGRQISGVAQSPAVRCQAVRSRVSTGGSVSPLDVDGWVVELMLLSASGDLEPGSKVLQSFFGTVPGSAALRVIWDEEPALRNADDPATLVHVSVDPLASVVPKTHSGIRVVMMGKYVPIYFDDANRLKMTRFASALYEATAANFGALYARCAEGRTHHLGGWFRASDFGSVSVGLVAAMGLYADVPHLAGLGLTEDQLAQRRSLSSLMDQTKKLDRGRLTMLLADDGGMLAARPGSWVTVTFPFSDGNRATRASLRIAESVGLGPRH